MNIDQTTEFFKWLTIINVVLFVLNVILILILRRIICKMHGKMFGLSEENISIVLYGWLGLYKVMIVVFNIVPFVALIIMGQQAT